MKKRGITLLIAVLVSSLVLVLGMGVFALLVEEIKFARLSGRSLHSFYAADSGAECALYWDIKQNIFSVASPPTSIDCSGQTIPVTFDGVNKFTFDIDFTTNNSCARVEYSKTAGDVTLISNGENAPCVSPPQNVVQRSLQIEYFRP
jgi:hypothetical protein